jgi:hypothetical protein
MNCYHFYEGLFDKIQPQSISTFTTILAGVLVFVIGQFILELAIKPLKEYRNIKSSITSELKYYSYIICTPLSMDSDHPANPDIVKKYIDTSNSLRRLSCELEAKYYDNHSLIRKYIIKDNIDGASTLLIALSNSLFFYPNSDVNLPILNSNNIDKIKKYLNLIK